jgi:hypothetical protein
MLTKELLTDDEKKEFYLNVNETEELQSREAFYGIYADTKENFLNKFYNKINNLATYSSKAQIILNSTMCDDVYHNIMNKEFYTFSKIAKHVENNKPFYIHNIRRASKVFLESLLCKKTVCYIVSPFTENLSLLNEDDPKSEKSLNINIKVAEKGLKIYRIFVIDNDFKMTNFIRTGLVKMVNSGISIRMVKKSDIKSIVGTSYDFIYTNDKNMVNKNIAIYQKLKERSYLFYVTKEKNIIEDLHIDYKKIRARSYKIDDFLKQEYQFNQTILDKLNGEFFHYAYGSKEGKENGKNHFWNNRKIVIDKGNNAQLFQDKKLLATGRVVIEEKQTTILMMDKNTKNSISISFDNIDTNYEIFKVIKIDKQFMEDEDMISVGLFSREKLDDSVAQNLLGDEEKIVFKVPSNIKKSIAQYCSKKNLL